MHGNVFSLDGGEFVRGLREVFLFPLRLFDAARAPKLFSLEPAHTEQQQHRSKLTGLFASIGLYSLAASRFRFSRRRGLLHCDDAAPRASAMRERRQHGAQLMQTTRTVAEWIAAARATVADDHAAADCDGSRSSSSAACAERRAAAIAHGENAARSPLCCACVSISLWVAWCRAAAAASSLFIAAASSLWLLSPAPSSPRASSAVVCCRVSPPQFIMPFDPEKLAKLVGKQTGVRTGGKGTVRRKIAVVHKATAADDKKLKSTLQKLSARDIPAIEEVNLFHKDGHVIHFVNPKVRSTEAQRCLLSLQRWLDS